MAKAPDHINSHWSKLIEGLQASPMELYAAVEHAIDKRKIPAQHSRVDWYERCVLPGSALVGSRKTGS